VTAAPVIRAASAGAVRRVAQSAVVFGVLAASSAAALLGLALFATASEGFYASCAVTHCADLAVTINDSSWLGWNMTSGRWYRGPHEVDASEGFLAATGRAVGDSITVTVNGKPAIARIAGEVFVPSSAPVLFTSWQALGGAAAGLAASHYDIALKPGTTMGSYITALTRVLGPGYQAYTPAGPSIAAEIDTSFFRLLALLVAALAALGVLNSVLMATRERVHDLGVFKAVGMTPRPTLAMVVCWVAAPAIGAAAIALPAGLITQNFLVRDLAASVGMVLPASFVHVLGTADLALLVLAGLGIAAAGVLGPATWAATSKTTTALRAE